MALFNLERKDDPSGNEDPIKIEVIHEAGFLQLRVYGYGECSVDGGEPIVLEHYQGKLQLHCFPDINLDEATTIDMEGANEESRTD